MGAQILSVRIAIIHFDKDFINNDTSDDSSLNNVVSSMTQPSRISAFYHNTSYDSRNKSFLSQSTAVKKDINFTEEETRLLK
jgi:hypothetical protein